MLKAACLKVPGLKEELQSLAVQHRWSIDAYLPDGSHVVPLRRWASVAGEFADGGYDALRLRARDDVDAPFVLSLIEELNSLEAIDQLFMLFAGDIRAPQHRPALIHRLVSALNLLFSVKNSPPSSTSQRAIAAAFLHKALPLAKTNVESAYVMYALRGTGNSESLDALADIEDSTAPFAGARAMAIRSIRKRLSSDE